MTVSHNYGIICWGRTAHTRMVLVGNNEHKHNNQHITAEVNGVVIEKQAVQPQTIVYPVG